MEKNVTDFQNVIMYNSTLNRSATLRTSLGPTVASITEPRGYNTVLTNSYIVEWN